MFCDCGSLISLNLSNFETSRITQMYLMFGLCTSLSILDLYNFKTSCVIDMTGMFYGCFSLTSINLYSFGTSNVTSMYRMFGYSLSFISLDLSNFNISKVTDIGYMFTNCIYLEYINLSNFDEDNLMNYNNIFYDLPENIVICINEDKNKNKILPQITNKSCYVIDCSDDWKLKQKRIINNTNECIQSCDNTIQYKYEYNLKCYENCPNGVLAEEKNKCKYELDKCYTCPNVALKKELCAECNDGYYPKENGPLNFGEYINCYSSNELEGYYLENNLFKECYHTCKICNKGGNKLIHNCIECNGNYSFGIIKDNYLNCYEKCVYYHYSDNDNSFICTLNSSCPKEYPILITSQLECIKNNMIEVIKDMLNNAINETEKTKEEEIEFYDNILN